MMKKEPVNWYWVRVGWVGSGILRVIDILPSPFTLALPISSPRQY